MKITVKSIMAMKQKGEKITALTAYEALFAGFIDSAGIDVVLVGDSAGMVFAGHDTTIPVTMDDMVYHAGSVRRSVKNALLVVDMPFMSYQVSVEEALRNAGRLVKEGGAEAVKLEGGRSVVPQLRACVEAGIPVMGHLGMTPQSVHRFGGFLTQGKSPEAARMLLEDALAVQEAGAFSLVLEKIPAALAAEITQKLEIPTIGIGAGVHTDGQILVTQDMLGMYEKFKPKFVRLYARLAEDIRTALNRYAEEVRAGAFPADEESY
ncbi:MAG: 3-methyl-2-oxobutanoate hydroxymethyltransferase [Candidatus Neomarinimicrobiota bacterium]|jgi:3-methyl-2-oxobutanoate hydroxymethyltransferase|nr:3-methyl-2-oxobutanoate hydroxymethyltransferase [Candidatus Neomarinimicrobiota bacterium]MDD3966918.1 3-methyl-2-oxobutanoate hydroxymethyltransferase [Candidatus Neomarinimicrobiota bacterium]MDX9779826.1 3-methyl-2-oxobutanoate hydroxymethyltransferase [bacterium]